MKLLWFTNIELAENTVKGTGSWLPAMSKILSSLSDIELMNISSGNVSDITRRDCGTIKQWIVPNSFRTQRNGLPPKHIVDSIIKAVDDFDPDLIHVWGVESYWGLLTARKLIKQKVVLEIQGIKGVWSKVFYGDLTFLERLSCVGLKEFIRGTSVFSQKQQFTDWGRFENEMIAGHNCISTQSSWTQGQIKAISPESRLFLTIRALRNEFCESPTWLQHKCSPIIFTSAGYSAPFKGLHTAVRALHILKKQYPDISLHIAGPLQTCGLRKDGYITWVCSEIRRLGLDDNVVWLGPLKGNEIIDELLKCSAQVLPTFIESYCLALAEAMMLGVPTAVAYTGGTSFLARDEESALFFPPGDEAACAHQLGRLLSDQSLATRLSNNARQTAINRNKPDLVIARQLEIYHEVLTSA